MSHQHLVSVIIPTRNRALLLKEAIESVIAVHRRNFEVEIIVVDDGSTDETESVVRAYPVTYIRTAGVGASAARNTGMHMAQGDFIAFLDDDDIWLPNNVTSQLQLLESNPTFGAAHAQVQLAGPDLVPYGEPAPAGPLSSGWLFTELLTYWPQLGSVVVRADVVRAIGDFDTSLHAEEEWDWLLRIARRYPIARLAQPVMLFRQRGGSDDSLAWHRLPDTVRVFRRQTHHLGLLRRMQLQSIIWKHRGWYTAIFLANAQRYREKGDVKGVRRCLRYALHASPFHMIVILLRSRSYKWLH